MWRKESQILFQIHATIKVVVVSFTHFSGKVSFVLYAADKVMEPTGVPMEPTLRVAKPAQT